MEAFFELIRVAHESIKCGFKSKISFSKISFVEGCLSRASQVLNPSNYSISSTKSVCVLDLSVVLSPKWFSSGVARAFGCDARVFCFA